MPPRASDDLAGLIHQTDLGRLERYIQTGVNLHGFLGAVGAIARMRLQRTGRAGAYHGACHHPQSLRNEGPPMNNCGFTNV